MTEQYPGAKYAISDVCGALDRCKDFLGHYMENMQSIDAAIEEKREALAGVQRELAGLHQEVGAAQRKLEGLHAEIRRITGRLGEERQARGVV